MILSVQRSRLAPVSLLLFLLQVVLTGGQTPDVTFNPNSYSSIRAFTKLVAEDIMSIYVGNEPGQTPGILPGDGSVDGYYWWVGGGMFGTFINYWHHTGDSQWNEETKQAIIWQSAPSQGGYFEPSNESLQLGNDDISFWAFAALEAAEYGFPNPDPHQPSWLEMVQGVFNRQVGRWDNVCHGGLRWQVYSSAPGYSYKNSISNGCFFNIGARLAKYTGNLTYAHWAEKAYDWSRSVKLIDDDFSVYDGLNVTDCSRAGHFEQWTYNNGVFLYGAAIMWNITGEEKWKKRVEGFLNKASTQFFLNDPAGNPVLTETLCEQTDSCQVDGSTFKAYLARWLRATTTVANWTMDQVTSMLQYSAPAAAAVCDVPGGDGGVMCGQQWYTGKFDGRTGIGMNMNAMEVMQTLIPAFGPLTAAHGGSSKGNASAGTGTPLDEEPSTQGLITVTTGDKAGAAILSILLVAAELGGAYWIVK